ncbi:uncharacterized protein LOC131948042 [Physella acuta]|uniref:uncharacterized protein LOC131948042 n=1 Tax=Physella acuta TaxID=109671 RepID=UPI0027DB8647|nr:uncharacterized protein LOC131948042 [Physella acuta]
MLNQPSGNIWILILLAVLVPWPTTLTQQLPLVPSAVGSGRALCPPGWLPASVPKAGFELVRSRICVKVNLERRWTEALGLCRAGRAFLVKLDSIVTLGGESLFDYLRQRGVRTIWTGVHHKYGTLLWDEMKPRMLKAYLGESERYGWNKRGWKFDSSSYRLGNKTCGALDLGDPRVRRALAPADRRVVKRRAASPAATVTPKPQTKPGSTSQGAGSSARPTAPTEKLAPTLQAASTSESWRGQVPKPLDQSTLGSRGQQTTTTTTTDPSDLEDIEQPPTIQATPTDAKTALSGATTKSPPPPNETSGQTTTSSSPDTTISGTTTPDPASIIDSFRSPLDNPGNDHDIAAHDDPLLRVLQPQVAYASETQHAIQQARSPLLSSESWDSNEIAQLLLPNLMAGTRTSNTTSNPLRALVRTMQQQNTTAKLPPTTTKIPLVQNLTSTTPPPLNTSRVTVTQMQEKTPETRPSLVLTSPKPSTLLRPTASLSLTSFFNTTPKSLTTTSTTEPTSTLSTSTTTAQQASSTTTDTSTSTSTTQTTSSTTTQPTPSQTTTRLTTPTTTTSKNASSLKDLLKSNDNLNRATLPPIKSLIEPLLQRLLPLQNTTSAPLSFDLDSSKENTDSVSSNSSSTIDKTSPTSLDLNSTSDNSTTDGNSGEEDVTPSANTTRIKHHRANRTQDTSSIDLDLGSESDESLNKMLGSFDLDLFGAALNPPAGAAIASAAATTTTSQTTTTSVTTSTTTTTPTPQKPTSESPPTSTTSKPPPVVTIQTGRDTTTVKPGQVNEEPRKEPISVEIDASLEKPSLDTPTNRDWELFSTERMEPVSSESSEKVDIDAASVLRQSQLMEPIDVMALKDCDEIHPSVCVSEAIEELSLVSHCDKNWYGHRLLDRCYKPQGSLLTEIRAREMCKQSGATLATADNSFYGNITAMLLDGFVASKVLGRRIWLDTTLNLDLPVDGNCSLLEDGTIQKVRCDLSLPFICQKDAKFVQTFADNVEVNTVTVVQNMTSFQPQTLPCPLSMSAFDEVIVWFKDGRPLIDMTDDQRSSYGQRNGQLPNNLEIDYSILERVGEGGARIPKQAMLQGEYWCEIWRPQPFHRVVSDKIFLKFTDVITLRGVIQTKPPTFREAALFNRMGVMVGLPARMETLMAVMNKNITHTLRAVLPIVRDVITFIKRTSPEDGRTEFVTYITIATGDLSMPMRGNLADMYLSSFYDALVQNEDMIRAQWNVTLPFISAVSVSMTDMCPETSLYDKTTGYNATFPSTTVNTYATSRDFCANGQPSGSAFCKGDLQTGAYWDTWKVTTSCFTSSGIRTASSTPRPNNTTRKGFDTPISSDLHNPEQVIVPDNVGNASERLNSVVNQPGDLTKLDIQTVADEVGRIVAVEKPPREISQQLVDTINKVMEAPEEELVQAETGSKATSRLVADLESFGSKVDMGSDPRVRYVTPNVAMELWNIKSSGDVVIGFGATESESWFDPLSEPRILTIKNRTWSEQNLPGFDIAIELPESLVKNSMRMYKEDPDKSLRLTMFLYRKTALFTASETAFPQSTLNSPIISASLGGLKIVGLQEKVRLVFKPFLDDKDREKRTRCVYWDTESGPTPRWSDQGCTYNGTLNGRDVCLCDHLTNFAILLDFYGDEKPISAENETSLSILSLIGIGLSIFGLAITIITFLAFKKLRQGRAQQTLFNMAIALLCFQTTFLVGVKQTSIRPVCLTVSVLLHYLILVSFAWMLIEAVLQYLTFVKVLGTYISRYTLKTVLPAWGLPLLPVIAVLATDYNLYLGRSNYCWMDLHAFYYAFALPVGIIVLFNIIMFFVIIVSLVTRPKGLRSTQANSKTRETNLKAAFTIFVLLGLTWLFGFLAVEDARLPFQYAFTIFSSLQGFLIFVLMVARRKQVRDQWCAACCTKKNGAQHRQKQLSPSSSSSNSSINHSRTLPSFVNHTYTGDSVIIKPGSRRESTLSA